MTKRNFAVLFAVSALIAASFMQPYNLRHIGKPDTFTWSLFFIAWFAPSVPFLMVAIRAVLPRALPGLLTVPVSILALLFGVAFSLVTALLWESAAGIVLVKGLILTLAAGSSILVLSFKTPRGLIRCAALGGLGFAALAAIWSLLTVPAVILHADRLAGDAPFCLAHHRGASRVPSVWDLRGFSFYTGHEYDYYDGLLLIDTEDGREVYNWSPSRFRFGRSNSSVRLSGVPESRCSPIADFRPKGIPSLP